MDDLARVRALIRDVPDFPSPGVLFKDITPLLADPSAFTPVVDRLADHLRAHDVDKVFGIEARGFIVGAPVAQRLDVGFVPVRKPGKLPWDTARAEYALEYGTDSLEVHRDAIAPGERVAIVDDVIATGGTAAAAAELVETLGGEVAGFGFVIELAFLDGTAKIEPWPHVSLFRYE